MINTAPGPTAVLPPVQPPAAVLPPAQPPVGAGGGGFGGQAIGSGGDDQAVGGGVGNVAAGSGISAPAGGGVGSPVGNNNILGPTGGSSGPIGGVEEGNKGEIGSGDVAAGVEGRDPVITATDEKLKSVENAIYDIATKVDKQNSLSNPSPPSLAANDKLKALENAVKAISNKIENKSDELPQKSPSSTVEDEKLKALENAVKAISNKVDNQVVVDNDFPRKSPFSTAAGDKLKSLENAVKAISNKIGNQATEADESPQNSPSEVVLNDMLDKIQDKVGYITNKIHAGGDWVGTINGMGPNEQDKPNAMGTNFGSGPELSGSVRPGGRPTQVASGLLSGQLSNLEGIIGALNNKVDGIGEGIDRKPSELERASLLAGRTLSKFTRSSSCVFTLI